MRKFQISVSAAIVVALFAALTACNNDSDVSVTDGNLSARLVVPAPLLSARAPINPSPTVLLNGNIVPAVQNGDSQQWIASIDVARNQQYQLVVRWQDDSSLVFAEAVECFSTADDSPISLDFSSDDYDTSQDRDADGHSNLNELNANTDPRDQEAPGTLAKSVLSLSLALPDVLKVIPDATLNSFEVRLLINGLPEPNLTTNSNNDGFDARAEVSVGSRAFIIIDWNYRLANGSTVRVARLAQPQQINESGETIFQADPAAGYRTNYDRDSDGRSNLDEVVSGGDAVSGVPSVCTG